jgi:hypothetical protein
MGATRRHTEVEAARSYMASLCDCYGQVILEAEGIRLPHNMLRDAVVAYDLPKILRAHPKANVDVEGPWWRPMLEALR